MILLTVATRDTCVGKNHSFVRYLAACREVDSLTGLYVKRFFSALPFFCLVILSAGGVLAQTPPLKGVVWQEPADERQAVEELRRMRAAGVEAVRTAVLRHASLLMHADSLGLAFFQELPVSYLPATRLRDTLAYATEVLAEALARARGHPSARHFGLAHWSDTSDPSACAYFEGLVAQIRMRPSEAIQTYYLSPFIEADQCAGTVDFVMLDARDNRLPLPLLRRWHRKPGANPSPVGIGALGTWVRADSVRGLLVPHTPEQQARYLEIHLNALIQDIGTFSPVALFIHAWQEADQGVVPDTGRPLTFLHDPYGRRYGLLAAEGTVRPAFDVMEGIYTGRQRVFAFPAGQATGAETRWPVLLGWAVFVLIGILYSVAPRFRFMVPRYFVAHAFYREAVRGGRDVLPVVSVLLLLALAVCAGIVIHVMVDPIRESRPFLLFLQSCPASLREVLAGLLEKPLLLILLLGSFYALGLATWATLFSAAARRRLPMKAGQVLMLMVWPRWTLVPVMVAAMVVSTLPVDAVRGAALLLAAAWVVTSLLAMQRTFRDFIAVTRAPVGRMLVVGLAHPLLWLGLVVLLMLLPWGPEARFLWHLITRA